MHSVQTTIFFTFCSYMYSFLHPHLDKLCHFIYLLKWQWKTGLTVNVIKGWWYFVTASISILSPKRHILKKWCLLIFTQNNVWQGTMYRAVQNNASSPIVLLFSSCFYERNRVGNILFYVCFSLCTVKPPLKLSWYKCLLIG